MAMTEFEIIEQYFKKFARPGPGVITGIGDDAALLELPVGHILAVSTDTLVNGIHFREDTLPCDLGFKSLSVNLSDLAAMAAAPRWVCLSITLPANDESWIAGFSKGFFELADRYGLSLVGGDLSHGPLSVTVQVMGTVPSGKGLRRSGARPGDLIFVTGKLGMASYALSLLSGGQTAESTHQRDCLLRLDRPEARVEIGLALRDIASAAIDISDGLAADLDHLLTASAVGAEVNLESLPVADVLKGLEEETIRTHCLHGGDDYELCFTAGEKDREILDRIEKEHRCPVTCIGTIRRGPGIRWLSGSGDLEEIAVYGYRHF